MISRSIGFLGLTLLAATACTSGAGDDDGAGPDAGPIVEPAGPWFACTDADEAGAKVVVAHDKVDHYINPGDNPHPGDYRNVDAEVDFPAGTWQRIFMRVE